MGHRRWLPVKHMYRDDKTNFDGVVEHGKAPWPLTGIQIQEMIANMKTKPGKGKQPPVISKKLKRRGVEDDVVNEGDDAEEEVQDHSLFTTRSILYDLLNWGSNAIRHITDVMHTEKNVIEHLINTIMGNNK